MDQAPRVEPDDWIDSCGHSHGTFGAGLAAWNDELLIGTSTDGIDVEDESCPPAACLFRRTAEGKWSHVQTLSPCAAPEYAGTPATFGEDLALGGTFALVGGVDPPNGDDATLDFQRTGRDLFALRARVEPPAIDDFAVDSLGQFGTSLAADERTLIVGAPYESKPDEEAYDSVGVVYVFDRTSRAPRWSALHGSVTNGRFGQSVALSGDVLVVGVPGAGGVHVYRRSPDGWSEIARVAGRADERFGHCVAIAGDHFVVAAPGSGRVVLFEVSNDGCAEQASLQSTPGFGESLAFRDRRLAIGDPMTHFPDAKARGRVALVRFDRAGGMNVECWLVSRMRGGRVGGKVALGADFVAVPLLFDEGGAVALRRFEQDVAVF